MKHLLFYNHSSDFVDFFILATNSNFKFIFRDENWAHRNPQKKGYNDWVGSAWNNL